VRAPGGNEQNQIYRQDPGGKEPVLLTDPARTHRPIATNRARNRLLVVSTDPDNTGGTENTNLALSLPPRPHHHGPAENPDARPLAARSARPRVGAENRDTSRHRLVRRHFFVRRPATRADRVQMGITKLRLGARRSLR